MENKDYKCPNCGMSGKLHDFLDGCPYCKTYYNIDYTDKELGSKYHYDRVLRNTKYRIITGIIDIIISLFLTYLYIINTSRTFNSYNVSKIFIYGFILSLILYYFFYIMDAYIILRPIKRYKDKQNQKQIDFWKNTKINKKNFFNNYNYEVRNKYYSKSNIIDYDNFKSYKKNNDLHIDIDAYVRIIYFDNGKISSKCLEEKYTFKKISNDVLDLKDGANMIKCHNCGASIDAKKGECEFCHTKIKYLQEWIIVE